MILEQVYKRKVRSELEGCLLMLELEAILRLGQVGWVAVLEEEQVAKALQLVVVEAELVAREVLGC